MTTVTKMTKAALIAVINEKDELIAGLRRSLTIAQAVRAVPRTSFMLPPEVVKAYFLANPNVGRSANKDIIRSWAITEGLIAAN